MSTSMHRNLGPPGPSSSQQQGGGPPASRGVHMGKLADMLEGVKRECEAISLDASMWKDQRDEMEAKIQQQIQESQVIRQALYDLESQHSRIRQEYEAEILHLRRELESRSGPGQPGPKAASSYAPAAPVLPALGGRVSPLPGLAGGGRGGTPSAPGAPSQMQQLHQQQQQQQQQQSGVGFLGAPPGSKPKSAADASVGSSINRQHSSTPSGSTTLPAIAPGSSALPSMQSASSPYPASAAAAPANAANAPFSANPPPPPPRHQPQGQQVAVRPPLVVSSDIDPESSVKELKKEGSDWVALWSPTAKRVLDVGLVHTLVHESVVCCVKFSQDGQWLATGCNRTVQIFDTKTGAKSCVLEDSAAPVGADLYIRTICFSPDGKWLATGAEDRQIRIWDVKQKRIKHLLQGHAQEIYSLDFSADGRHVVSGSGDKSARIWDIETGSCVFDLKVEDLVEGDTGPVDAGLTSVAFSPDGRLFAAGSLDAIVRLWDTATGVQLGRFAGHSDSVYSVAFSPDGKTLCSGSLDRSIRAWDISGPRPSVAPNARRADPLPNGEAGSPFGACVRILAGHKDYVLSVGMSNDGRWIVSGSKDRTVQFFDSITGQVQLMVQGHKNSVISIDLSKSSGLLASGSGDLNARIWSYNNV